MQFRERRRVIQVIRTVYDPAIKRGRAEVVGRIDQDDPKIDAEMRAACSAGEVAEIEDFLVSLRSRINRDDARQAAETLAAQMRQAEAWFVKHADGDVAPLAAEIWTAWDDLSKALKKAGAGKSKRRNTE